MQNMAYLDQQFNNVQHTIIHTEFEIKWVSPHSAIVHFYSLFSLWSEVFGTGTWKADTTPHI